MQTSELDRAIAAALSTARSLGLHADDAVVLQNSNKLALRLRPCDSFARVSPMAHQTAQFEIDVAARLAETGSPAASLDPRVPPTVHQDDGFTITFWTYYPSVTPEVAPSDFANALWSLHSGMRRIEIGAPHFTDRVAEAEHLVANPDRTPDLKDADRAFLSALLKGLRQSIVDRGAAEQLLHGEPHAGNVLGARLGPLFIDLETCCHGPIEFDLAHAPEAVAAHYPEVEAVLLSECRALVLAMVAAWRWDAADEFPGRDRWRELFMRTLRAGAPWPSLHALGQQFE
jgi:aminoglycoside phosphotransferase (APT) family kinase protein